MHLLWDWNGTLLDDTSAAIATLNQMLFRRGLAAITPDFYRNRFSFPVRSFYALIGFKIPDVEWDGVAQEYHTLYALQPRHLSTDAVPALRLAHASGVRQHILSALREDLLNEEVKSAGVRDFFEFVCGTDNLAGGSKMQRAQRLINALQVSRQEIVLIGDSLHDQEVAAHLGIDCVLYGGGSHAAHRLAAVAPVGKTLMEAVTMALSRQSAHLT